MGVISEKPTLFFCNSIVLFVLSSVVLGISIAVFVDYHSTQKCSNAPALNEAYYEKQQIGDHLIEAGEVTLARREALLESPMGSCLKVCEIAFCIDPFAFSPRACIRSFSLIERRGSQNISLIKEGCSSFEICLLECHDHCFVPVEQTKSANTNTNCIESNTICL